MTQDEQETLLRYFKALADETRLQIVGLLSVREYRVSDLAEALELTEPTVSHHLARLREVGLLNLRTDGTSRFYRLNKEMLKRMTRFVEQIEDGTFERQRQQRAAAIADMGWIDALALAEDDRKVLHDYFRGRTLKDIPSKLKKLMAILRYLATLFEPDRAYSEAEVNAILKAIHPDYAQLRRALVDQGFLRREGGGGAYWRTSETPEV